jgi:hypothetical protein
MIKRITHCTFIDRQLKYKCQNIDQKLIFPPKFAPFVNFRSLGEKSGKVVGMKSSIAPIDVGEEEFRD